nr:MAG TPA: prohead protease [Caudoviricetes sp.]
MDMLTREYAAQAQASGDRLITGIAVPYDDEIEYSPGWFETVARDAFNPETNGPIKLFWQHSDVIGTVTEARNTEAGLEITARISETSLGNDVYALAKDGAIDRFSIGFIPIDTDTRRRDDNGAIHAVHTAINVREVSLVPFPAYENAKVTDVRAAQEPTTEKEPPIMTESRAALDTVLERMDSLEQAFAAQAQAQAPAPVDTRSAAQVLKALAAGDAQTRDEYNGTVSSADGTMTRPTWIVDLTRLTDRVNPLKELFSVGTLPKDGMSLEYTELKANTIAVNEQAKEGANLQIGGITTQDKTTPVKTFGGYTTLSRQAIERTRIPLLQTHLQGMALAAGKASAAYFASVFNATASARATAALTSTKVATALTWSDLAGLIVDAADYFQDAALPLDGLIVDKPTFKALAALTAPDGRPLMTVSGTGANTVGTVNPAGLAGALVGIKVVPNLLSTPGAMGEKIVGGFYSSLALRTYETPVVQLQDENILNLTQAFSVYRYQAVAAEIPAGIVPLKLA